MAEQMQLKGTLKGHNGWVTQIATNARYPNMIISSSRGMRCHDLVCGQWAAALTIFLFLLFFSFLRFTLNAFFLLLSSLHDLARLHVPLVQGCCCGSA